MRDVGGWTIRSSRRSIRIDARRKSFLFGRRQQRSAATKIAVATDLPERPGRKFPIRAYRSCRSVPCKMLACLEAARQDAGRNDIQKVGHHGGFYLTRASMPCAR